MFFENVVSDSTDPQAQGRFWQAALGTEQLTDEAAGFETRLATPGGPEIDLCFQKVGEPTSGGSRVHLDLSGGTDQQAVVDRLLTLGATHLDIGQGDVSWVVLADPEGHAFCVLAENEQYAEAGPVAAIALEVADPERDGEFWAWLTGWVPAPAEDAAGLRHPSGRGPFLELSREERPKGDTKNRTHLDLRLEAGDDVEAIVREIAARGGRELHFDWGALPWRHFADPSGNEFCLLPARS